MGAVAAAPQPIFHPADSIAAPSLPNSVDSMSQGFHPGIFRFSEGFQRPAQQHVAQQNRRDKMRVPGAAPVTAPPPSAAIRDHEPAGFPGYEQGSMLSDMFNFNQIGPSFQTRPELAGEWYGSSHGNAGGHADASLDHRPVSGLNTDSAAAMHLFLMNAQPGSPSPPSPWSSVATAGGPSESQRLSLSLSSSLQQFEVAAKTNELGVGERILYFNQIPGTGVAAMDASASSHLLKNLGNHSHHQAQYFRNSGSMGGVDSLRNSKYKKAAEELLQEFCSVGRGCFMASRNGRKNAIASPEPSPTAAATGFLAASMKEPSSSLSPNERLEHQRRKAKLITMLEEVDKKYSHHFEQMQMVVNSFESIMGIGAAAPYTSLARRAMSRRFRCIKDAIVMQLKHTFYVLGEMDDTKTSAGCTQGETPRLRLLDQAIRQQRSLDQVGTIEQEAWRPQRGLPEHSVSILRAWLFEHFLHPYPNDADKHFLARQTGLSRNQVSNWFINARVRLWKPMVEEMYQQEAKEVEEAMDGDSSSPSNQTPQSPLPPAAIPPPPGKRPQTNAQASDPSNMAIRRTRPYSENQAQAHELSNNPQPGKGQALHGAMADMWCAGSRPRDHQMVPHLGPSPGRVGSAGDVSLTLGLRHAGNNMPEKTHFSVSDFGGF